MGRGTPCGRERCIWHQTGGRPWKYGLPERKGIRSSYTGERSGRNVGNREQERSNQPEKREEEYGKTADSRYPKWNNRRRIRVREQA